MSFILVPARPAPVGDGPGRRIAPDRAGSREGPLAEPRSCCESCAKCVYCRAVDTIEIG